MSKETIRIYSNYYEVDTEVKNLIVNLEEEIQDLRGELRQQRIKITLMEQKSKRPKSLFSFLWR